MGLKSYCVEEESVEEGEVNICAGSIERNLQGAQKDFQKATLYLVSVS